MKIHTVRSPFMCREGQFEAGKRTLCVGLDLQALKANKEFWCYLGTNRKTHYEIESAHALAVGQQWRNKTGRTVIIVPLNEFKQVKSEWDENKYQESEYQRSVTNGRIEK